MSDNGYGHEPHEHETEEQNAELGDVAMEIERLRSEVATWRTRWEQMQARAERSEAVVEAVRLTATVCEVDGNCAPAALIVQRIRAALARYDGREG